METITNHDERKTAHFENLFANMKESKFFVASGMFNDLSSVYPFQANTGYIIELMHKDRIQEYYDAPEIKEIINNEKKPYWAVINHKGESKADLKPFADARELQDLFETLYTDYLSKNPKEKKDFEKWVSNVNKRPMEIKKETVISNLQNTINTAFNTPEKQKKGTLHLNKISELKDILKRANTDILLITAEKAKEYFSINNHPEMSTYIKDTNFYCMYDKDTLLPFKDANELFNIINKKNDSKVFYETLKPLVSTQMLKVSENGLTIRASADVSDAITKLRRDGNTIAQSAEGMGLSNYPELQFESHQYFFKNHPGDQWKNKIKHISTTIDYSNDAEYIAKDRYNNTIDKHKVVNKNDQNELQNYIKHIQYLCPFSEIHTIDKNKQFNSFPPLSKNLPFPNSMETEDKRYSYSIVPQKKDQPPAMEITSTLNNIGTKAKITSPETIEAIKYSYYQTAESTKNADQLKKQFLENTIANHFYDIQNTKLNSINPDKIKFDILIEENRNGELLVRNKDYQYIEDYRGILNKDALNIITTNHPGELIAYKNENENIKNYGIYSGIKTKVKDPEKNNVFIDNLKNYFSNSLRDKSSVLLQERKENIVDYSVNADSGKYFTGIQQLYLQQIRNDNKFESPYFLPSNEKLNVKQGSNGTIMADYDKKNQTLTYQFFYNFDQLYNTNNTTLPKIEQSNLPASSIVKTDLKENEQKRLLEELSYNTLNYLSSIYSGTQYKPTSTFKDNAKKISNMIDLNQISLLKVLNETYKKQMKTEKRTISNNNENEQRQRSQNYKKGRGR